MCVPLGEHSERLQFFLIDSPTFPLLLGHSWLVRHKPQVNWGKVGNAILHRGPQCLFHCDSTSSAIPVNRNVWFLTCTDSEDEDISPAVKWGLSSLTSDDREESFAWDSLADWSPQVDEGSRDEFSDF